MFNKRNPDVGSPPGTLVISEESKQPRIQLTRYTRTEVAHQTIAVPDDLNAELSKEGVLWIEVHGLGDARILQQLAKIFSIHALTLEDIVNMPQRPKTEAFEKHQLYITRMVQLDLASEELKAEQVSLLVGANFVMTFHENDQDVLAPVRNRIHRGKGPIRKCGADYLAYAIIDCIIDGYYPVLEQYGEILESLELRALEDPTPQVLAEINRAKRQFLVMRRGIWPQRDAINTLIRDANPFIGEGVSVYLRDCYDHCVQISDVLDNYRELVGGLLSTYISAASNRTNEIMKVLTIMASIFIPLTFLAGVYGMNFEKMPELKVWWAYPLVLFSMAVTAIGMLWFFYRKGWIGIGRRK